MNNLKQIIGGLIIAFLVLSTFVYLPNQQTPTAKADITSGLVGYWKFDEGSGTTASDSAGSSSGTLTNGPTWGTGKVDGALNFGSNNSHVSVPSNSSIVNLNQLTLSAWINPTGNPGADWGRIIHKRSGTTGDDYALSHVGSAVATPNRIGARIRTNLSTYTFNSNTTVLPNSGWHHVAMTWNGSQIAIYIDGVLDSTLNASGTLQNAGETLNIGAHPGSTSRYFNGLIDDARVYNRALSTSDISELYSAGGGTTTPPPPPPTNNPPPPPPTNNPPPPPPSGTANVYVSTSGNDTTCVRNDSTKPCLSFSRAYTIASGGDVVEVAGGNYSTQSVPLLSKGSAIVTFKPVSGGTVTLGGLTVNGSYVEVQSMTVTGGVNVVAPSDPPSNTHHVTIRNVTGRNAFIVGEDILVQGGSYGGFNACATGNPDDAVQIWQTGSGLASTRITFDSVVIHDVTDNPNGRGGVCAGEPKAGIHSDCLQILAGHFITIRNSTFYNCPTSAIIARPFRDTLNDITIENNFMQAVMSPGATINKNGADNWGGTNVIRYNTIFGGSALGFTTGSGNLSVYGNIMYTGSCGTANYSYNVFLPGSAVCGSNAKTGTPAFIGPTPNPVFLNGVIPNYHLASTDTVAKDAGDPTRYPSADFDGESRFSGAAPDIGADEIISGQTTPPPPPPSGTDTANVWVDTNGGSCTRSATPVAYNDSQACGSIGAGWNAALTGDIVVIKNGTYGAQTITGDKSAPGVRVVGEDGVTNGVISANGAFLTLENITIDAGPNHGSGGLSIGASNVTLKNVKLHGPYVSLSIYNVSNVSWIGGELGELGKIGGKRRVCVSPSDPEPVQIGNSHNITFDNIDFYPQDADLTPSICSSNGFHLETIRIDLGGSNFTVRNSRFHNGDQSNTSTIFITNTTTGTTYSGFKAENNFFGSNASSAGWLNVHTNVNNCANFTIAYNKLNAPGSLQCANFTNGLFVGNLGWWTSFTPCRGTHTRNVWQDSQNFTCGTDTVVIGDRFSTNALGLSSNGYHLLSNSPAINAAETGGYCTSSLGGRDMVGNLRPNGSACDAGAYEFTGSQTNPPPPPPSTISKNITIDLEGRTDKTINGTLEVLNSSKTLIKSYPFTTNSSGTASLNLDQTSGSLFFKLKASPYLSRLLSGDINTTLAFPQLKTGDINQDNIVNSIDFSTLNTNWFTTHQTSDLNRDTIVNSLDFSLMNRNWFVRGEE